VRKHLIFFGCIIMAGESLCGQGVSFGVLGGVPFNNPTGVGDESRRYVIGPSMEVRLPAGFAMEADALYRRIGSDTSFYLQDGIVSASFHERARGNSWEFPILGKYYFRSQSSKWRPFVGTGFSFRIANEDATGISTTNDPTGIKIATSGFHLNNGLGIGATGALGLRFQKGRWAVLPQIRYTRWSDNANHLNGRNDAAFLLGITF
jgi:hypothetical protein